jgi:hypothetical protein
MVVLLIEKDVEGGTLAQSGRRPIPPEGGNNDMENPDPC